MLDPGQKALIREMMLEQSNYRLYYQYRDALRTQMLVRLIVLLVPLLFFGFMKEGVSGFVLSMVMLIGVSAYVRFLELPVFTEKMTRARNLIRESEHETEEKADSFHKEISRLQRDLENLKSGMRKPVDRPVQ